MAVNDCTAGPRIALLWLSQLTEPEEQGVPQEELPLPLGVFVLRPDLQDLLWDLCIRRRYHQWACFDWATRLVLSLARRDLKAPSILSIFLLSQDRARQHVKVSSAHPSLGVFEYTSAGVY